MQHPFCNKIDFNLSLVELDITKKAWITKFKVSYEWLSKILSGEATSPRVERAIIATVKKAEEKRILRLNKREQQLKKWKETIND